MLTVQKKILNLVSVLFLTSLMLFVGCKHDADLSVDPVDPGNPSGGKNENKLYISDKNTILVIDNDCYYGIPFTKERKSFEDDKGEFVNVFWAFNNVTQKANKELYIGTNNEVIFAEDIENGNNKPYTKLSGDYTVYTYEDMGACYYAVINYSGNIYALQWDSNVGLSTNVIEDDTKSSEQVVEKCEYTPKEIKEASTVYQHLGTYKVGNEIFYLVYLD